MISESTWTTTLLLSQTSRQVLIDALRNMTPTEYVQLGLERCLAGSCSYPPCGTRLEKAVCALGFCSKACKRNSGFLKSQLSIEPAWFKTAREPLLVLEPRQIYSSEDIFQLQQPVGCEEAQPLVGGDVIDYLDSLMDSMLLEPVQEQSIVQSVELLNELSIGQAKTNLLEQAPSLAESTITTSVNPSNQLSEDLEIMSYLDNLISSFQPETVGLVVEAASVPDHSVDQRKIEQPMAFEILEHNIIPTSENFIGGPSVVEGFAVKPRSGSTVEQPLKKAPVIQKTQELLYHQLLQDLKPPSPEPVLKPALIPDSTNAEAEPENEEDDVYTDISSDEEIDERPLLSTFGKTWNLISSIVTPSTKLYVLKKPYSPSPNTLKKRLWTQMVSRRCGKKLQELLDTLCVRGAVRDGIEVDWCLEVFGALYMILIRVLRRDGIKAANEEFLMGNYEMKALMDLVLL